MRRALPAGEVELILCRNLVFTYFSEAQQREVGSRLLARLTPGGYLFVGSHEALPEGW